jgi:hypothetical protein
MGTFQPVLSHYGTGIIENLCFDIVLLSKKSVLTDSGFFAGYKKKIFLAICHKKKTYARDVFSEITRDNRH